MFRRLPRLTLLLAALLLAPAAWMQAPASPDAKPAPDLADIKYGPHQRNVLDLWKARSDRPTPLVVFIHGGGFSAGGKEKIRTSLLRGLLARGISVMAINYRFSPEVAFPAHHLDSVRAIQFARLHAREWNLDASRFAATGGSAGAGISLWIAFNEDLADRENSNPLFRQSTRLSCVAVSGAQSSYDPRVITRWIGAAAARHPALMPFYGLKPEELDTPKAHRLYEAASAITFLTADDPPVYAYYGEARGPLRPDAKDGEGIHHIEFGHRLKEQMDRLGIECVVRHADERPLLDQEMVDFLDKWLSARKTPASPRKRPSP